MSVQEQILMHRWRYPSLSLHGIEGAFSEAGAKTVIPRKVIGKFSIRLVPDMDPKVVEKQVWRFFFKILFNALPLTSHLHTLQTCATNVLVLKCSAFLAGYYSPGKQVCRIEKSQQTESVHGTWSQSLGVWL